MKKRVLAFYGILIVFVLVLVYIHISMFGSLTGWMSFNVENATDLKNANSITSLIVADNGSGSSFGVLIVLVGLIVILALVLWIVKKHNRDIKKVSFSDNKENRHRFIPLRVEQGNI